MRSIKGTGIFSLATSTPKLKGKGVFSVWVLGIFIARVGVVCLSFSVYKVFLCGFSNMVLVYFSTVSLEGIEVGGWSFGCWSWIISIMVGLTGLWFGLGRIWRVLVTAATLISLGWFGIVFLVWLRVSILFLLLKLYCLYTSKMVKPYPCL